MAEYVNIIFSDGTNKTSMKVPKNSKLLNKQNRIFYAKEGSLFELTKEQYKAAIALSKLDGNGGQNGDLDAQDIEKFAKMSKAEQIAYINKALGNNSKYKVGKNFDSITDETTGIVARKDLIAIPMTINGEVEEDPHNLFRMEF